MNSSEKHWLISFFSRATLRKNLMQKSVVLATSS